MLNLLWSVGTAATITAIVTRGLLLLLENLLLRDIPAGLVSCAVPAAALPRLLARLELSHLLLLLPLLLPLLLLLLLLNLLHPLCIGTAIGALGANLLPHFLALLARLTSVLLRLLSVRLGFIMMPSAMILRESRRCCSTGEQYGDDQLTHFTSFSRFPVAQFAHSRLSAR